MRTFTVTLLGVLGLLVALGPRSATQAPAAVGAPSIGNGTDPAYWVGADQSGTVMSDPNFDVVPNGYCACAPDDVPHSPECFIFYHCATYPDTGSAEVLPDGQELLSILSTSCTNCFDYCRPYDCEAGISVTRRDVGRISDRVMFGTKMQAEVNMALAAKVGIEVSSEFAIGTEAETDVAVTFDSKCGAAVVGPCSGLEFTLKLWSLPKWARLPMRYQWYYQMRCVNNSPPETPWLPLTRCTDTFDSWLTISAVKGNYRTECSVRRADCGECPVCNHEDPNQIQQR